MSRMEMELEHMLLMISPPFFHGWRNFIWDKAKRLAQQEPMEFADLPRRLEEAVLAQRQSSISSEKPAEQLGTDGPGPKPAGTPTTARLASTGLLPTSSLEG